MFPGFFARVSSFGACTVDHISLCLLCTTFPSCVVDANHTAAAVLDDAYVTPQKTLASSFDPPLA